MIGLRVVRHTQKVSRASRVLLRNKNGFQKRKNAQTHNYTTLLNGKSKIPNRSI